MGGSALVFAFLYYSDPNGGALTATLMAQLATPVIAVWFAHLARKALFDYTNLQEIYDKAKETSIGAAILFAGVCLVIFALLGLFGGQVRADTLDHRLTEKASVYIPTLKAEQQTLWADHPNHHSWPV